VRLDEKSSAGFAVISWHDQLQLAWTGTDMRINLASSPDGGEITAKQRLDQRSYTQETISTGDTSSTRRVGLAPALAAAGDRLYVAWTGSHAALNLLAAEAPAQAPLTLRERSGHAPSLATSGDAGPPVRLDGARTRHAPVLCSHQGSLIVGWCGTDGRLNLARLP
jgi:hypothetical protein